MSSNHDPGPSGSGTPRPQNSQTVTPSGRSSRKSVPPSNPSATKKDTFTAAKTWILDNLEECEGSNIPKNDILRRYTVFVNESGQGGVTDITLGNYISQSFPRLPNSRLGARGPSQ